MAPVPPLATPLGGETWAVKKAQWNKLDVAEMLSGVTKLDRKRNETIRETARVGEISKKVQ